MDMGDNESISVPFDGSGSLAHTFVIADQQSFNVQGEFSEVDGGCSVDESLDMNDTISGIQTLDVQNMEYTKTDGLNVTMRFRIQIIGG